MRNVDVVVLTKNHSDVYTRVAVGNRLGHPPPLPPKRVPSPWILVRGPERSVFYGISR